jgi:GxxExxY protein
MTQSGWMASPERLSGPQSRSIERSAPVTRIRLRSLPLYELQQLGLQVQQQRPLPVVYKSVRLDCGHRPDLVVEDEIVVEIKWVERLNSVHDAQLISYLKLSNRRVGLLINFNVRVLKHGLRRVVNDFPDSARSAVSAA